MNIIVETADTATLYSFPRIDAGNDFLRTEHCGTSKRAVENPINFDGLLHQAGLVFQKTTGCSAAFSDPVVVKSQRSLIVRCKVKSAQSEIASVIIKQVKEQAVRGFSDWASLTFLSGLREAGGIAPRFYGGDVESRLFLIEDLGEGKNLHTILADTDPMAARAALQTLASQMARLHAVTMGKQGLFENIRFDLPETDGIGCEWEARHWLDNRTKIFAWFKALECAPPAGFDRCLEYISGVFQQPGEFLAFTHGDPAPSNNHFAKNHAWLLDFEYGTFRHALYDITAWNVLCALPQDCVREMSRCFREELAKTCAAARDEARFAEAWACLCAYRALAILTWMPVDIIVTNRPWADQWTMREAVFVALSRLKQAAAAFSELEAAGEAAGILVKSMQKHWPEFEDAEALLPQWPALKNRHVF